jgi:hypothetical protein
MFSVLITIWNKFDLIFISQNSIICNWHVSACVSARICIDTFHGIKTFNDLRSRYFPAGPAKSKSAQVGIEYAVCMIKYVHIYLREFSWSTKLQHSEIWSAAVWLLCRLLSPSSILLSPDSNRAFILVGKNSVLLKKSCYFHLLLV